jgi:hypothetical protein
MGGATCGYDKRYKPGTKPTGRFAWIFAGPNAVTTNEVASSSPRVVDLQGYSQKSRFDSTAKGRQLS